jgi:TetR/AcrR family transcriptional repressor of nem operon
MTVGRPLEFNPERVLDAAMDLFWRQGYDATSLQSLLKVMGLSKSSLYQAFGNKQQLFEQCLQRYQQMIRADWLERLNGEASGRQFIIDTLLSTVEEAHGSASPRGCLIMNTASEFAQSNPKIAEKVNEGVENFKEIFFTAVQQGQADGTISRAKDPELLANYLVSSMSGLRTMVKAGSNINTVRSLVSIIIDSLD